MRQQLLDGVPVEVLEQRMWPGRWCAEGYLRQGDSLPDVIAADAALLARLGVEPAIVAARLENLLERGSASEWEAVRVDGWLVTIRRTRKMRACPWAESNIALCRVGAGAIKLSSNDFEIRRRGVGGVLEGTGLSVHLIRDHGFFCGPSTPYRIEPEFAVNALMLIPGS